MQLKNWLNCSAMSFREYLCMLEIKTALCCTNQANNLIFCPMAGKYQWHYW